MFAIQELASMSATDRRAAAIVKFYREHEHLARDVFCEALMSFTEGYDLATEIGVMARVQQDMRAAEQSHDSR